MTTHAGYTRTQNAPVAYILYGVAAIELSFAWRYREWPTVLLLLGIAAIMLVFALALRDMTIRDEGERLAIRYGPLPLFRKRIPYSAITAVEAGRTSLVDGWGIHYVPGRGWTYNLWGFHCARVSLGRTTIRIGSDDVDNLVRFLRGKMKQRG